MNEGSFDRPPVPNPSSASRRERWCLAAILLAGAGLRAAYLRAALEWPWHREVLLVGDGAVYHDAARRILSGSPWGVPISWQDPLYPTFLALATKITGSDLAGPLAVQHALGVLSAWLAWAIARRMGGGVAGLVAAALAALSPVPIFYEGLVEKSAPGIFLFGLAAWGLGSGLARGSAGLLVASGIALALTALLRGNALLVIPAAALAILLARPRPISAVRALLAFTIGIGLVFGPTMSRNRVITGSLALTAGQGGANFWLGNQAGNRTGTFQPPRFLRDDPRFEESDWKAEAERRAGRMLEKGEVSRFWFEEGLRTWWQAPGFAVRNTVRKALLFVSAIELPDTQTFPFFRERFAILRLPLPGMGPICALAIVGAALSLGAWRARAPEIALLLGYAGSVTLFFVLGRYRVVALPLLAAFAGVAAGGIVEMARRRDVRALGAAVAALALSAGIAYRARAPERYAFPYFNLAFALSQQGRYEEAAGPLARGLTLDPHSIAGGELEARIAMARGDLPRADAALGRALARAPERWSLRVAQARLRARQGRREEAIAMLQKLSEEDPMNAQVRRELQALRATPAIGAAP